MFELRVVTPKKQYLTTEVDSITLPSVDGQRTVLSDHMTTVIALEFGNLYTKKDSEEIRYVIGEGLFTFENNVATLLIDSVESESEIDFARASLAEERAESRISSYNANIESGIDLVRAKESLYRARVRKGYED